MEKYKICPNPACKKHNKPKAIECAWCEMPLTGVKVTDDETEAARQKTQEERAKAWEEQSESQVASANITGKMTRICESCGQHNPPNARKCTACGEDISDIVPTQDGAQMQPEIKVRYRLKSLDGGFVYEIPEDGAVVGRENKLSEYLTGKSYVSRRHAALRIADDKLFVKNLNTMNHTYVNNARIENDTETEVHSGDEIGFGGNITNGKRQELAAYFIVEEY